MNAHPPLIQPARQDEAFLADLATARAAPADDTLRLWWLGQSGFLALWRGRTIMFDPYLSDSLTRKYSATDKPHVRLTARVVDPSRLAGIDVVTSSHNHTDHLDAETLLPLFSANPAAAFILPAVNTPFARARLGDGWPRIVHPLAHGESCAVAGFAVTAVPAAHEELSPAYAGFVVRAGPHTVYHSGDTLPYPGMVEQLRPHHITLALLPINGRAPERRVAGNLDGPQAAQLARDAGIPVVVPCHYDMFAFNTASPDAFVAACRRLGVTPCVLRAGARAEFSPQ
jgi:L-ascorbate metabolism protein UlaG (beta-lactamase superfamily)